MSPHINVVRWFTHKIVKKEKTMASCTVISSGGSDPSFLRFRVPFQSTKQNENYLSKVILVIDRSGSMSGSKTNHFFATKPIKFYSRPMETSSSSCEIDSRNASNGCTRCWTRTNCRYL